MVPLNASKTNVTTVTLGGVLVDKLIALKTKANELEMRFQFSLLIDILFREWRKNSNDEAISMLLIGQCFYVPFFTVFTTDDYGMKNDKDLDINKAYDVLREAYLSGRNAHKNSPTYNWYTSLLISTQRIIFETAIPGFPKDEHICLAKNAHMLDPESQLALSQWKIYSALDNIVMNRELMIRELKALHLQSNMVDQNLAWYFANYNNFDISMEDITV
jgi:hypothetical protein